ncbi:hypothetical protein, partial [Escherichia coli]|uniref:hypothetical protein n=1 Tax=Escherichia coli TaxID=562 RepID=UPI000A81DB85
MQHVPEGVIQAPESPDAPEALPGCRSISDDDLCAWCTRLLYRPGEISLCRLSIQAMASGHPSVTGTVTRTAVRNFSRISFIPDITGSSRSVMNVMFAYFHERRSLNNFHRDRVITFEQIAE